MFDTSEVAKPRRCRSNFLPGILATVLFAVAPLPAIGKDYPAAMQFQEFAPCRGSASFCAPQLLAIGDIDADAADRLRSVLDGQHDGTVAFDSPGGSLKGGLALGMLIRERGLDTRVAPTYLEEVLVSDGSDTEIRPRVVDAGCFSACAYAFMGGVSRTIEEGGEIGVHQFYGARVEDAQATAQAMTALLSQYLVLMGVDRELLDAASFTDSAEMFVVPVNDAIRYNLDNQHPLLASWQLIALDGGETAVRVAQQQSGGDRETSIAIVRHEDEPQVLAVVVRHGPFPEIDARRIAEALKAIDSKPMLCAGKACAIMYSAEKWHYEPETKTILGTYIVDIDPLANVVLATERLHFIADFPNVYSSIAPDVELGRSGLRNALLAIYIGRHSS